MIQQLWEPETLSERSWFIIHSACQLIDSGVNWESLLLSNMLFHCVLVPGKLNQQCYYNIYCNIKFIIIFNYVLVYISKKI